ncbi:hypothetical protein DXG01_013877 [Tephrocybe rancida]|nr:hypothetical protein DXG01_013877 [Tephrocybe rancida]
MNRFPGDTVPFLQEAQSLRLNNPQSQAQQLRVFDGQYPFQTAFRVLQTIHHPAFKVKDLVAEKDTLLSNEGIKLILAAASRSSHLLNIKNKHEFIKDDLMVMCHLAVERDGREKLEAFLEPIFAPLFALNATSQCTKRFRLEITEGAKHRRRSSGRGREIESQGASESNSKTVQALALSPSPLLQAAHANLRLQPGAAGLSGENDIGEYLGDAYIAEWLAVVLRRRKSGIAMTVRFLKTTLVTLCSNVVLAQLMREGDLGYPGVPMKAVTTKCLGDLFELVAFETGKQNTREASVGAMEETFVGLVDVLEGEFYKKDTSSNKRPSDEATAAGPSKYAKTKHTQPNTNVNAIRTSHKRKELRRTRNRHIVPNENVDVNALLHTAEPSRNKDHDYSKSPLVEKLMVKTSPLARKAPLVTANTMPNHKFCDFVGSSMALPNSIDAGFLQGTNDSDLETIMSSFLDKTVSCVHSGDTSHSRENGFAIGDPSCVGASSKSEHHTHRLEHQRKRRNLPDASGLHRVAPTESRHRADRSRKPWLEGRDPLLGRYLSSNHCGSSSGVVVHSKSPRHRYEYFDDRSAQDLFCRHPAPPSWLLDDPDDGYRRCA